MGGADAGGGRAERLIGSCWNEVPREKIFLASKVGWDPGPHGRYYHPEQIRRQLESSLRNLRTDVRPGAPAEVTGDWHPSHWGTQLLDLRDPDGRAVVLQSPGA